jgi:uncharacterized protein Smg (DUF494 family)
MRYDLDFLNNDLYWDDKHLDMIKKEFRKLPSKHQALFQFKEDILKLKNYQHILVIESARDIDDNFEIQKMKMANCQHQLLIWLCSHCEEVYHIKINQKVLENYTYFEQVKKLSNEIKILA